MIPDSVVEVACRAHFGLLKSLDRTVDWDHYVAESALPDRAFTEKIIAEHRRRMRLAIETAAPMMAPQWIPCSERMPEKGERVLVLMACRKRAALTIATWTGEVWFHHVGDYHEKDVSHWMPLPTLPQPPKEKQ